MYQIFLANVFITLISIPIMSIIFGPAGLGSVKTAEQVLEKYHERGIKACEIAFVHQIYIKNKDDAIRIGKKAKDLGIKLSIHAQYYVNLNSAEKEKRKATKERILGCCAVGHLLQAKTVVFHPGYYGNNREGAYEVIKKGILEIMKKIEDKKWNITISAETMGKVNVFGSVDEIANLVNDTGCGFCIDFAHILARDKTLTTKK